MLKIGIMLYQFFCPAFSNIFQSDTITAMIDKMLNAARKESGIVMVNQIFTLVLQINE